MYVPSTSSYLDLVTFVQGPCNAVPGVRIGQQYSRLCSFYVRDWQRWHAFDSPCGHSGRHRSAPWNTIPYQYLYLEEYDTEVQINAYLHSSKANMDRGKRWTITKAQWVIPLYLWNRRNSVWLSLGPICGWRWIDDLRIPSSGAIFGMKKNDLVFHLTHISERSVSDSQ